MRSQTQKHYFNMATQTRSFWACLIALALILNSGPKPTLAVSATSQSTVFLQTEDAPLLPGTFQVVNNQAGSQANPHVSCNLVSYTFDDLMGSSTVHYYDLSTGADGIVPGNGVDLLSRVSGSRIVLTEVTRTGDTIVVFDPFSGSRTVVPGLHQSFPSVGGNLLAFEKREASTGWAPSEIATYDLATQTLSHLTNDALLNRWPVVSPSGDVVVWEKCQTNGLGCDIYAAIQTSPGVFTTRALTQGGGEEHFPSTTDDLVVYVSDRTGENDIYYHSLTGDTEVRLSIPGDQRWPTVSGNLISFETWNEDGSDIFVYDVNSGRLFRVTDTPGVNSGERLSEINVCSGVGRIVYALPDNDFDVYAFTFQPPSGTESQINDLISLIRSFGLPPGAANSLSTKLEDALTALEASDTATACSSMTAFINECQAQSGKKLTPDQSTQLISSANQIKTDLGCR